MLIDQKNIELAGVELEEGRDFIMSRRIDWEKLIALLDTKTTGDYIFDKLKRVFARVSKGEYIARNRIERIKSTWKGLGYDFTPRKEKDVDSWIVSEMWGAADSAWNTHKCTEIHFAIASGDGVFARELHKLIRQYDGRMRITVTVFTWHGGFNRQWLELTSEDNIILLDSANIEHPRSSTSQDRRVVS